MLYTARLPLRVCQSRPGGRRGNPEPESGAGGGPCAAEGTGYRAAAEAHDRRRGPDPLPRRGHTVPPHENALSARSDRVPAKAHQMPAKVDEMSPEGDPMPTEADEVPDSEDTLPSNAD